MRPRYTGTRRDKYQQKKELNLKMKMVRTHSVYIWSDPSRAAEKGGKKLVSSDFAKILEYESSN